MKGEVKDSALTAADLLEAENLWIIDVQDQVKSDPKFKHWKAQMLINAFGQSAEQLQTCDQVQFTVGSLNDSYQITIDAYVVPEIGAPTPKTGNSRSSVPLSLFAGH